jgi:hypothetical protein
MGIVHSPFSAMPCFANLPTEIEERILEYLADDKKALYSTIRVSQAWHEHTNGLLWQHFSALDLANIKGLPRRQGYANKVVELDVSDLACYSRFRFLSFPALTEVTLDALPEFGSRFATVRILPFLPPTLRKLHLRDDFVLTLDAMDLKCLKCPLLEDLEIAAELTFKQSDKYLVHAAFNFPKLLRLVLTWDNIIPGKALKRLSEQLPSLQYLDIGYNYFELWGVLSGVVFPELRTFKMDSHQIQPD